jgi:hypothetical protein
MAHSPEHVIVVIDDATPEPFENLPAYADDFFNAIGRAVLMWGKLEQSLDNLLLTAINVDALHGERRPMQVALGKKLNLLKEVYKTCPPLLALRARANALATRTKNLGDDRHLVMHSTWLRFEDGPPPRIVLRNIKHSGGRVRIREFEPTFAHLVQIAGAFHGARAEALTLLVSTNECGDPGWEEARRQALQEDGHCPPTER